MCACCTAKREGDWDILLAHHYCPSEEEFRFACRVDSGLSASSPWEKIEHTNDRKFKPRTLDSIISTVCEMDELERQGKKDAAIALSRETGVKFTPITIVEPKDRITDIIHLIEGVIKRVIKLCVQCVVTGSEQEKNVLLVFEQNAGVTFNSSDAGLPLWKRLNTRRLTCVEWRHMLKGFFRKTGTFFFSFVYLFVVIIICCFDVIVDSLCLSMLLLFSNLLHE